MNLITGLVGPPGAGKSTAQRLGRYLIADLGEMTRDSVPIGSGEGMVEAYLRTVNRKSDDGKRSHQEKERAYVSAYFYVDEAEGFINRTKSEASTTLATLRTLWSGGDAGAINAQVSTTRHLHDSTYRFAAVFGFQPAYAIQLIAEDKAGTPQRFLFVSALDRTMPDVPPSNPGPLTVKAPPPGVVSVDREILRLVSERHRRVVRGELELDPLDAHRSFLQLRAAYLLAVLCGDSGGVSLPWWNLAGRLLDTSRAIVQALRDEARRLEESAMVADVDSKIQIREIAAEKDTHRIGANLMRYALEAAQPTPFPKLKNRLRSTDRHKADADEMVRLGYLRRDRDRPNLYVAGNGGHVDTWTSR